MRLCLYLHLRLILHPNPCPPTSTPTPNLSPEPRNSYLGWSNASTLPAGEKGLQQKPQKMMSDWRATLESDGVVEVRMRVRVRVCEGEGEGV